MQEKTAPEGAVFFVDRREGSVLPARIVAGRRRRRHRLLDGLDAHLAAAYRSKNASIFV
jgi:hypothetical protein